MREIYKYKFKLAKTNAAKFISHLDWQGAILKTFKRMGFELVLSEGFNKMPKAAYSPALPIFIESECEIVTVQAYDRAGDDFIEKFEKLSPAGIDLIEVEDITSKNIKSLDIYIQWAKYEAKFKNRIYNFDDIGYIIEKCLASDNFEITKKTKKGITKKVNYRKSILKLEMLEEGVLSFTLKTGSSEEIPALRADEFLKNLFQGTRDADFRIKRTEFLDKDLNVI